LGPKGPSMTASLPTRPPRRPPITSPKQSDAPNWRSKPGSADSCLVAGMTGPQELWRLEYRDIRVETSSKFCDLIDISVSDDRKNGKYR
jgi:hypothetical protein